MPIAPANSIEIAYETFGQPQNPGLVLITGLGEQMVAWSKNFVSSLSSPFLSPGYQVPAWVALNTCFGVFVCSGFFKTCAAF